MFINDNELSIMFDVDQTLIMWDNALFDTNSICIVRPDTKRHNYVLPHIEHIELLKQHHHRGYWVTVWSASGTAWAVAVVEALELKEYVNEVRTKPLKFVDDLQANEILGTRVYIELREK